MALHGIVWFSLIWLAAYSELLINCYFIDHCPIIFCFPKFASSTKVICSLPITNACRPPEHSTFLSNLKQWRFFFLHVSHLALFRTSFNLCTLGSYRALTCCPSFWESTGIHHRSLHITRIAPAEKAENLTSSFWPQPPILPIIPLTHHYLTPLSSTIFLWPPLRVSYFSLCSHHNHPSNANSALTLRHVATRTWFILTWLPF